MIKKFFKALGKATLLALSLGVVLTIFAAFLLGLETLFGGVGIFIGVALVVLSMFTAMFLDLD